MSDKDKMAKYRTEIQQVSRRAFTFPQAYFISLLFKSLVLGTVAGRSIALSFVFAVHVPRSYSCVPGLFGRRREAPACAGSRSELSLFHFDIYASPRLYTSRMMFVCSSHVEAVLEPSSPRFLSYSISSAVPHLLPTLYKPSHPSIPTSPLLVQASSPQASTLLAPATQLLLIPHTSPAHPPPCPPPPHHPSSLPHPASSIPTAIP